jgi:hypothetical protein
MGKRPLLLLNRNPPPCLFRLRQFTTGRLHVKGGVNVWSAAFLQATCEAWQVSLRKCIRPLLECCSLRAMMECAAPCSSLRGQSRKTVLLHRFPERQDRPLCHLIVRQQAWQVLKKRGTYISQPQPLVCKCGNRRAISTLGVFCQAAFADQLRQTAEALAGIGGRYTSPLASTAHEMRARLLASAMAATLVCFREDSRSSQQLRPGACLLRICRTARAPWTKSLRK